VSSPKNFAHRYLRNPNDLDAIEGRAVTLSDCGSTLLAMTLPERR
jgi:hypothetical protein